MDSYRLSARALRDLAGIRRYLVREAGVDVADKVETALFDGFDELVRLPWIGHPRNDIHPSTMRFHRVYDYMIMFHREPRLVIARVVHGARNLPRVL